MTANEFNRSVVTMSEKLYRFSYRYLQDAEQSQDAVQEVFIKLWNQRDRLDELNSIEAFAIRITRNHCLDIIKARRTVSLDENAYFTERISDESDPEKELYKSDSIKKLTRIVEELTEPHRTVIRMRDMEGYSNEEVGDVLGLSAGNIRVVLSRARKKVRLELEKIYDHGSNENKNLVAEIL
jgi:RNA polymerase sigma factor (sigma-70 family)